MCQTRSNSSGFSLFSTLYWSLCTSWSTQNWTWLPLAVTLLWDILPDNLAPCVFLFINLSSEDVRLCHFYRKLWDFILSRKADARPKNSSYSETPQTTRLSKQTNGNTHKEHNKTFANSHQMVPANTNRQLHIESHFGNPNWSWVVD